MAVVFHHELAIPLWAVAFCAVALAAPPRLMPSVITLLGIAVVGSTMLAMLRWLRTARPLVAERPVASRDTWHAGIITTVMTAGIRARTLDHAADARTQQTDDSVDLVRTDDGGWQMARNPALTDGRAHRQVRGSNDTRS